MQTTVYRCFLFPTLGALLFFVSIAKASAGIYAEIEIEAPINSVWKYVQDDLNASDWSIFFASIEMAPVEDYPKNSLLTPADVGFVRRCYRNDTKTGLRWDEETIAIIDKADSITKEI